MSACVRVQSQCPSPRATAVLRAPASRHTHRARRAFRNELAGKHAALFITLGGRPVQYACTLFRIQQRRTGKYALLLILFKLRKRKH